MSIMSTEEMMDNLCGLPLKNDWEIYICFNYDMFSMDSPEFVEENSNLSDSERIKEWVRRVDSSYLGKFNTKELFIRHHMAIVPEFHMNDLFIDYLDFDRIWNDLYSDYSFIEMIGTASVFDKSIAYNE